ncbi:MAG: hypothetical protein JNK05_23935 [Myxococcales bacterium]|nr:hypothetical protein [Myxococcales bacterium]
MATHARSRFCLLFASLTLGACAPAMTPPVDASSSDASSSDAVDASAADAAPDSPPTDAPVTCVNVSGSWEWTGSCSDPQFNPVPGTCLVQTGCQYAELANGENNTYSIVGNVARREYTRARDGLDGVETLTFDGDNAAAEFVVTAPVRATCRATGRRGSFAGASNYCCDVSRASCGASQRCVAVQANSNIEQLTTACVADGTIPLGGECTRVMNRVGTDQCQGNAACANFGQATSTARVCQKLCDQPSDCAANQVCRRLGDAPRSGVCTPRCELGGTTCQPAATCRFVGALVEGATLQVDTACDFTGMRTEGMACTSDLDCGANLNCPFWTDSPVCRRTCDATHACPMGTRCEAHPLGSATSLGACVPE